MNVPDYVWEQISELLDLGISLIPIMGLLSLIVLVGVIAIFITIIRHMKEAERIREENRKKEKEFEQRFQKQQEEMETFRKEYFPDD